MVDKVLDAQVEDKDEDVVDDASIGPQKDVKDSSPAEKETAADGVKPETPLKATEGVDIGRKAQERIRRLISERKELESRITSQDQAIAELKGMIQSFQRPQKEQLTYEQEQAVHTLRSLLGVDSIIKEFEELKKLKSEFQELSKTRQDEAFDQAQGKLLEMITEDGLNPGETPDDVLDEVEDFINGSPVFSKVKGVPQAWVEAYKSLRRSNPSETAKRQANKELVEHQAKQKAQGAEVSGTKGKPKASDGYVRGAADIVRKLEEQGGLDDLDIS